MNYTNLLVVISLFTLNTCHTIDDDTDKPSLKTHQELKYSPSCLAKCVSHNGDKYEPKRSAHSEALLHLNMAMENFMKTLSNSAHEITKDKIPMNCADIMNQGGIESGIYTIYPYVQFPHYPVSVLCDQKTDSGGWTTIQARMDAEQENFDRPWTDYQLGFGKLKEEHWIGLKNIYALTNNVLMELRVDIEYANGNTSYAKYNSFRVEDESKKFQLRLGTYEGTAGDRLSKSKDRYFKTFEKNMYEQCRATGFWNSLTMCNQMNLDVSPKGRYWDHSKNQENPIRTLKMMIKPAFNA